MTQLDPGRAPRVAMLLLEQREMIDLEKGLRHPKEYYDMDMIIIDSPSQHSTPFTPTPFTPSPSPLAAAEHQARYQYPILSVKTDDKH
jgi:hypothetical protein